MPSCWGKCIQGRRIYNFSRQKTYQKRDIQFVWFEMARPISDSILIILQFEFVFTRFHSSKTNFPLITVNAIYNYPSQLPTIYTESNSFLFSYLYYRSWCIVLNIIIQGIYICLSNCWIVAGDLALILILSRSKPETREIRWDHFRISILDQ